MKISIKTHILIVDNNIKLSNQMAEMLREYDFEVLQAFNEKEVFLYIDKSKYNINLIILNTDFHREIEINIFDILSSHLDSKFILLSSEDTALDREKYELLIIIY